MKSATLTFFVALATLAAADRSFTVTNNCAYTVWPALFTGTGTAPSQATGWELAAGTTATFSAPDNWTSGRIWPRTECDASGSCATGGCDGGLECTGPASAATPATIAEFTFSASQAVPDNYDVSIVDGFNVPVKVASSSGCAEASCPADLNASCPTALQFKDASGAVVGCFSDCQVDSDPTNSPSCCTGSFNTPSTCPASRVPHYAFFKTNCPEAYVFPYDETSEPLTCTDKPNYTVTFCPA
ncbi:unnamed protein product [Peniophora sp. CBMAI 1063]|nr:unnamed protein product [Peniophora sp. CBMAI 1063]